MVALRSVPAQREEVPLKNDCQVTGKDAKTYRVESVRLEEPCPHEQPQVIHALGVVSAAVGQHASD